MSRRVSGSVALASLVVALLTISSSARIVGQIYVGAPPAAGGQWAAQPRRKTASGRTTPRDIRGTRYSPLDQINASNFNKLEVAWRFKTDNLGPRPEFKLEGTPLMVKGVLYTTGGTRRSVIALDAKTGELIWAHSLREGKRAAVSPRQLSGRGVSYWTDGKGDERIIYVTTGYRLVELNAKTGALITSFGNNGVVDLKVGVVKGTSQQIDLETGEIGVHSTPTVVRDVVIVGSAMREGATVVDAQQHQGPGARVRRADRQAALARSTPFRARASSATTRGRTIRGRSTATPACGRRSRVDEELGLVYLPVETPTSDFYGGHRPGNNLFAESLVCVDLKTGQRKWHFQFVHHPLWNFDTRRRRCCSTSPSTASAIKAVARAEQAGVALRVRSRHRPAGLADRRAAGAAVATCPARRRRRRSRIPTKPPAYARNYLKVPDDLIDFTPELRAQALERLKRYKYEPSPFTPPILGNVNGLLSARSAPATATNWPGSAATIPRRTSSSRRPATWPSARDRSSRRRQGSPTSATSPGIGGQPFREVLGPGDCCAADAPRTAERAREPAAAAGAGRAAAPRRRRPPAPA